MGLEPLDDGHQAGWRWGVMLDRLKTWFSRSSVAAPVAPMAPNAAQMAAYGDLCRRAGVDRVTLLLTFDCDTNEDIAAAAELDASLRRRGINAGYAVPGVQLQAGADVWRRIADNGAEFLNHGFRAHAAWQGDRYHPVTFYNEMTEDEVVADIHAAHDAVRDVIGSAPDGFRAPHFGTFHAPEQLALLYRTLKPLGYSYSSGTIPALALARGPLVASDGFVEIPTMGSYRYPTTLLDSWTYLTDRVHYVLSDEYSDLFAETVERMTADHIPGLLTYYADPAHVIGQRAFERVIDIVQARRLPTILGRDAVRRFQAL
jgi:peptidoglycan/xylan/chitin deacetylase (PgdA/CDA1 family)